LSRVKLGKKGRIEEVTNFTSSDYLMSDEVNALLFDKGRVYVATAKGISVFSESANVPPKIPQVFIENIQINNKDTTISDFYELPYDQNNINIRYKSPAIRSPERIFYKYLVTGAIVDSGSTYFPDVKYGSLNPGDYTIMIWARSVDGIWSQTPAVLKLRIKRPIWKTWWFILGITGLITGIVAYIVYNRFQLLRNKAIFKTRISESELKVLRLQMNPEFIFDTLNSLQKFTLTYRPLEANKYIAKFSRLMRCSMDYADKPYISLEDELSFSRNYIDLEQLRFERKFDCQTQFGPDVIPGEMLVPPLILQPFLEGVIRIALHIGVSVITLAFEKKANCVEVTIETRLETATRGKPDTKYLKEGFSKGIVLTEERLKLLLQKEKINTPVTLMEWYHEEKLYGITYRVIIPNYND
jgi:hypothetical protein